MSTPATANPQLQPANDLVELVTDQLETPLLGDRSYRVIILPNKLEALLVHDPDTDMASAAMDVNVGSFSEHIPGLAHLMEHMLSMGTEKYPVVDDYEKYLTMNSGFCNAFTGDTSTNYFFEVAAKPADGTCDSQEFSPLYEALDRFSQMFIDPLLSPLALESARNAVDSENDPQNDEWRLPQLHRSLSNPNHPYCRFSVGNHETLKTMPEKNGIDICRALRQFHKEHYSANRMKLVVLGTDSLDTLQEWVADLFAGIKNDNLPPYRWEAEKPLGPNELLTQYFVKPIMDTRSVELIFPYIDEELLYESQPSRYITYLLGHKGPGSIMAQLKSKGWADPSFILEAEADPICPGTPGIFSCFVQVTEEGLEHYIEIVKIIFRYISLLQETPPQEWIYNEQQRLAEVDFTFAKKTAANHFTSYMSATMQKPLPRERLLSHSRPRKFDPVAIKTALACLNPDNFRIAVVSKNFPGDWDKKEKWYGTEYKNEKIPKEFLIEIKQAFASKDRDRLSNLRLPHENPFIPTRLDVERKDVKTPSIAPRIIRNDHGFRIWFKKDDTFWEPRANVFIKCTNPLSTATAGNILKTQLYKSMVIDVLEEFAYDAELTSLSYDISNYVTGIEIVVSGYNDKLQNLLEKVLTTLKDLVISPDRFEILKESLLRSIRNEKLESPYIQLTGFVHWLNGECEFTNDQLLEELEWLTVEDVQSFRHLLLRQMFIEALVHGNLYKKDALCIAELVENILKPRPLLPTQLPIRRCVILNPGCNFVFRRALKNPKNAEHCIGYYLHIGDRADRVLRSRALLLGQLTEERAYYQLRTQEKLSYILSSGTYETPTTITYRIIIQSKWTTEYLDTRIESFLESYEQTLQTMSEDEFQGHKRSLIINRSEKLTNLDDESGRLWDFIDTGYFDFERVHHDATDIEKLTKSDMIQFYKQYISPRSPTRAMLAFHLHAQGISESSRRAGATLPEAAHNADRPTPCEIYNVRDFKSGLSLSPGPRPVEDLRKFEELD